MTAPPSKPTPSKPGVGLFVVAGVIFCALFATATVLLLGLDNRQRVGASSIAPAIAQQPVAPPPRVSLYFPARKPLPAAPPGVPKLRVYSWLNQDWGKAFPRIQVGRVGRSRRLIPSPPRATC